MHVILLDEKLYKDISVIDISYKTSTGPKPLHVRLNKINGFMVCGSEFRCLVLFNHGLFDKICDKIKYLISGKSGITERINHNLGKIRIGSYNSLPIDKILTFHNVIILIKSVVNMNKTEYYYNIFLEKGLYKDKSDTQYFQIFVYYKCYISIELTLLKELMLIKQLHQKSAVFATIGIS